MPLTDKLREIAKENHELELTYGFKAKMLYPVGSPEFDSSEKMVLIEKSHADRLAEALVKACEVIDILHEEIKRANYCLNVSNNCLEHCDISTNWHTSECYMEQAFTKVLAHAREILGGGE